MEKQPTDNVSEALWKQNLHNQKEILRKRKYAEFYQMLNGIKEIRDKNVLLQDRLITNFRCFQYILNE